MRPRLGLRGRLLLAVAVASLLAMALLVGAFNVLLDSGLRGDADRLLRERSAAALRTLNVVDGNLRVGETPDRGAQDVETWVFDPQGLALEQPGARAQAPTERARQLSGGYATAGATRLYATPIIAGSRRLGTLVVGSSLAPYRRSARDSLLASMLLGAALVLVLVAVANWAITRALRPVAEITQQAADWGARDLGRRFLRGEPHDELTQLASTFDALLDRLAEFVAREQRFTAEISHELRTPLARILAQTELAPASAPIAAIAASALELQRTLDTLLLSATRRDARAPGISAGEAARRAAAAGVELILPPHEILVAVDPELLHRTLSPLLENAHRFARERVTLRVAETAGRVRFEVDDDGPGVAPELRERIFDPGFSTTGGSGAGLGLPLARRLAESAGGTLTCTPPSTFVLELPGASGRQQPRA